MILLHLGKLSRDIISTFLETLSRYIIPIFLEKSFYQEILFLSLCHKYLVGKFVFSSNSHISFLFKWPFALCVKYGFSRV